MSLAIVLMVGDELLVLRIDPIPLPGLERIMVYMEHVDLANRWVGQRLQHMEGVGGDLFGGGLTAANEGDDVMTMVNPPRCGVINYAGLLRVDCNLEIRVGHD
jgi:hypothetical protein